MEAEGKHSKKGAGAARRPGRPFKLPWWKRVKWVGIADEAKRLGLLLARMQQLPADAQARLVKLPLELQVLVVLGAWGRHSRYLNVVALRSALAPPLDGRLRHLVPKGSDPTKWTDKERERASRFETAVRNYQRKHFGKRVGARVAAGMAIHIDQPSYVSGLWRDIDQWVADHLDISLSTFRSWRRRLVAERLLVRRKRQSKAGRRSGQQLMTRLAQGPKGLTRH
jgi:hypothetical protein